eukprot:757005-Hanusia_phi.AAC.2
MRIDISPSVHLGGEETIAHRQQATNPDITLYSSWFCPFAQRVWAYLEELAEHDVIQYQWIEINPYEVRSDGGFTKQPLSLEAKRQQYPDFVDVSPRGLVPAINHDGFGVNDSMVICEYLSDVFEPVRPRKDDGRSHGVLLPGNVQDKTKIRIFWEHISSQVIPCFYRYDGRVQSLEAYLPCRLLMCGDQVGREDAHVKLLAGLRYANNFMLSVSSSGFFLGEGRYSLADLSLAPWKFQVPNTEEYARLHLWWQAMLSCKSFCRTLVSPERLMENYEEYSDGTATSEIARSLLGPRSIARNPAKIDSYVAKPLEA